MNSENLKQWVTSDGGLWIPMKGRSIIERRILQAQIDVLETVAIAFDVATRT